MTSTTHHDLTTQEKVARLDALHTPEFDAEILKEIEAIDRGEFTTMTWEEVKREADRGQKNRKCQD